MIFYRCKREKAFKKFLEGESCLPQGLYIAREVEGDFREWAAQQKGLAHLAHGTYGVLAVELQYVGDFDLDHLVVAPGRPWGISKQNLKTLEKAISMQKDGDEIVFLPEYSVSEYPPQYEDYELDDGGFDAESYERDLAEYNRITQEAVEKTSRKQAFILRWTFIGRAHEKPGIYYMTHLASLTVEYYKKLKF